MDLKRFHQPEYGFCRDCFSLQIKKSIRCQNCGSPRLLQHKALYQLNIAHIDCDAFFAAIEKRDNPALQNKPVIIGGGRRGVVSTACYNARLYGVHSAMPMFQAKKLCPDAIIIFPNMAKYNAVSRNIKQLMRNLTPLVESLSIDEAFLDMHGTEQLHGAPPAYILAQFAQMIQQEIGISISIGLSYCKFLAKLASDFDKPHGFHIIGKEEAQAVLAERPVTALWGVGRALATTLANHGITQIKTLQKMEEDILIKRYGTMGKRLYHLARGQDPRPVKNNTEIKSISAETTFPQDLYREEDLLPILRNLSETVSHRLKSQAMAGQTVVLKLKTSNFKNYTRNQHLTTPTQMAEHLFQTSRKLLCKELGQTRFRLIGLGVQQLTNCLPATSHNKLEAEAWPDYWADPREAKRLKAERATDYLRNKFGKSIIETGLTFASMSNTDKHNDQ